MPTLDLLLWIALWVLLAAWYAVTVATVGVLTFRNGRPVLGILGLVCPYCWFAGAVLPPKAGAPAARQRGRKGAAGGAGWADLSGRSRTTSPGPPPPGS
jgi:hypothetical protein